MEMDMESRPSRKVATGDLGNQDYLDRRSSSNASWCSRPGSHSKIGPVASNFWVCRTWAGVHIILYDVYVGTLICRTWRRLLLLPPYVRVAGLEPARLSPVGFKPTLYT